MPESMARYMDRCSQSVIDNVVYAESCRAGFSGVTQHSMLMACVVYTGSCRAGDRWSVRPRACHSGEVREAGCQGSAVRPAFVQWRGSSQEPWRQLCVCSNKRMLS